MKRNRIYVVTPLRDRFFAKVEKAEGCWRWIGGTTPLGYGYLWDNVRKSTVPAHRVSYQLHRGDFDQTLCVCHRCDNPNCVNPQHLFLGTVQDNSRDMANKGRQGYQLHPERYPAGSEIKSSKLTTQKASRIKALRSAGATLSELAKQFGVSHGTIGAICKGRTWRNA